VAFEDFYQKQASLMIKLNRGLLFRLCALCTGRRLQRRRGGWPMSRPLTSRRGRRAVAWRPHDQWCV